MVYSTPLLSLTQYGPSCAWSKPGFDSPCPNVRDSIHFFLLASALSPPLSLTSPGITFPLSVKLSHYNHNYFIPHPVLTSSIPVGIEFTRVPNQLQMNNNASGIVCGVPLLFSPCELICLIEKAGVRLPVRECDRPETLFFLVFFAWPLSTSSVSGGTLLCFPRYAHLSSFYSIRRRIPSIPAPTQTDKNTLYGAPLLLILANAVGNWME
jgi:hypothetical protein